MGRFGIILLLTTALLVPVVICVVPGTAVAAESDCCDHMTADCGSDGNMSECCSIAISELVMTQPAAKIVGVEIQVSDVIAFPPVVQPTFDSDWFHARFLNDGSGSPPTSSPGFTAVLRI